jgi:hypothetical protein
MVALRPGVVLIAVSALALVSVACGGSGDDEDQLDAEGSPEASASVTRTSAPPGSSGSPDSGSESPEAPASPGGGSGTGSATPEPGGGNGGSETPTATPTFEIVTPVATATFVAAEGEYCDTVTQTSPPNSIFGLLEVGGEQLPAGTEVFVAFDGVPGPAEATREAGGYRVDFGPSTDSSCANKAGAEIAIVVNGVAYETGRVVGSAAAIRFDIVEP